ncbi:MAG TPA: (deoxy)nucleoside triphosphate pyrophosphohydrolase [Vicinamibacterales bacterium]|nr:(deoxy)nucleoside triphosphate pyrophosphohydrolase [Vicinamibacterales bacterium]
MTSAPPTVVTAAVIERDGKLLVARRLEGTHLAGHWEFPGGKCEPGEEIRACLVRELLEELGVSAAVGGEIHRTFYAYDDRRLELIFFECEIDGEPRPLLGQEIRWVARADLRGLAFPPADAELIEQLGKGQS